MVTLQWEDDDLWNILSLPNKELYRLYGSYYDRDTIRRTANKYRNRLRWGEVTMPERSTPYEPDKEPAAIERRVARAANRLGKNAIETTTMVVPVEHLHYHQKLQQALTEDGAVSKARFSDYEMGYKDADGEAQSHQLHAARFEVAFESEPKWPPITRVESVKLARREKARNPSESETCFVFSDLQVPFEDENALEVALSVMRDVKPDRVVFLGDLLDLSAWSKYEQQPEWALATQDAIVRTHQLLAKIRKTLPESHIQVMSGNHEARMPKTLLSNARAAYGLKRADQPEGWPVLSVPYLTAMDTLDVEWIGGYPANRIYLSPQLQIIHGSTSGKGNAGRTGRAQKISTIFGHDHRLSMDTETINTYDGGEQIRSYGAGCLCRIDGHVPSVKMGREVDGSPIRNLENWSQGFVIATYIPNGGPFHVEQVAINTLQNHQTMFRGKIYEP